MAWVDRSAYMERLWALEGTRDIKVITGMRRSGRSELMKAFSVSVARKDPSSNNVYIDLLDLDNEPLLEYHALHRENIERHKEGARNRLFIDEVQLCEGFEKAINSIHARGGWDIYLTGLNAFLLSSDLATLFTGRHREVHILPISFGEYRSYFGEQGAVDDDFDGFIGRGCETYVGKLYQKEVDFVAKRGSELVYIQVSDDISSESTLERELAPLLSIRDAFPKVLIARTRHEPYTREGVLVLDLARWLLGEQEF